MAAFQMGEHGQTMGRQAASVVFPEVIARRVIAIWWETAAAE